MGLSLITTPIATIAGALVSPTALGPWFLLLGFDAALAWRLGRAERRGLVEFFALVAVQAVTLTIIRAFLTVRQIGSGDSYHYGLQLADFLAQLRHGVFPVFVGQSEFGFNGNIHTLRTAPYYVHFGALLDLLTGRQLPAFALRNLCLIFSAVGGVTSTYVAVRILAPSWRLAAPLLAVISISCPTVMVMLIGEMYATFQTLPWLPLFWLGIAGSLLWLDDTKPLILSVGSLALIWYGHPAIGVWLTPVLIATQAARLILLGRAPGAIWRPLLGALALGCLVTYAFVSVQSLHLIYEVNRWNNAGDSIFGHLKMAWADSWKPLKLPLSAMGDIQLGYALAAGVLFGLYRIRRSGLAGWVVGVIVLGYLLLLMPIPGITRNLWALVPNQVINATSVWPAQRFYTILAAAIPVWVAITLRFWPPMPNPRGCQIATAVLAVAALWSLNQARPVATTAFQVTATLANSEMVVRPGNIMLTRSSYLMFDFYPDHYSHGVMEPSFEVRLLDGTMQPLLDNAPAVFQRGAASPVATLTPQRLKTDFLNDQRREASFITDGHSQYLFAFNFEGTGAGDIELISPSLYRHYILPEYGESKAFGSGPQSSPYLPVCLPPGPPETIVLRTNVPKLSCRVIAFRPEDLPIQTRSLIPLVTSFDSPRAGYVETPRVLVPGYEAKVNGVPTPIVRSPSGLVAVPIPAGHVEVTVDYPGTPPLRRAFWFSLGSFILLPLLSAWAWWRSGRRPGVPVDRAAIARYSLFRRPARRA